MSERRELVIGQTVLGRPIEAVYFMPPSYAKPRPTALLFAAIHGDEPVSQLMLERLADELVERPPGRETWIVPCVNVDGILAGTRNNANDVDLNRNFASKSWGEQRRPGYNPGAAAEDQPEPARLTDRALGRRFGPASPVPHGQLGGAGRELAEAAAALAAMAPHATRTRAARRQVRRRSRPRGITLEIPFMSEGIPVGENPPPLRHCLDLPPWKPSLSGG
jgi:protein MpaA